jgi:hypothetical protein
MRNRKWNPLRLLVLLALVALATASVGCESTTYVGVSYGYPAGAGPAAGEGRVGAASTWAAPSGELTQVPGRES